MSTIIDALTQRREGLVTQATAIAQRGVTESRDLTVEEQTEFDRMFSEAQALEGRIKSIVEGEQNAADLEASFQRNNPEVRGSQPQTDGAFGKWAREARNGDQFDVERTPGAEQRAVDLRGRGEVRDMSATGGIGKQSVYSQLWEYAVAGSQILQSGVTIINTADGNTIPMPRVTVHATGASAAAGANITASDATIDTVDLSVIKRGYITYVPSELLQDATFDIEGYLSRAAGRELGRIIGTVASAAAIAGFTASGAVGPTGTASGTLGAQATAGQGADLLVTLFHSVLPEYRSTASWIFSDTVAALLRRLKDSTGQYIWQNSLVDGDPDRILGKPVFIDSNLPSWTGVQATDSATKPIYFGDLSSLTVRIAGGLRFERSNDVAFAKDAVAFRALVRTGAAVLDANAAKFFIFS